MSDQPRSHDDDEVLAALEELTVALRENNESNNRSLERAKLMRQLRAEGKSYTEIVAIEGGPLVVELIAGNMRRLSTAGSKLRRAEARALRSEGMTMDAIAKVFGVTRQRISELLRTS